MKVNTTVCIRHHVFEILERAEKKTGIPRTQMVSSLLNHASKKARRFPPKWARVRYRMRTGGKDWRRMHVSPRRDEYDFFLDLRNVWKMSVSHIIEYAIEQFVDELLVRMKKNSDNYRYRNYALSHLIMQDVICWIHYWGIPPKLLLPMDKSGP